MIPVEPLFWLGTVAMAATTVYAVAELRGRAGSVEIASVAGISGTMGVGYALMALGIGTISVDGATVYLPRYANWLLATPLLLAFLCRVGNVSRRVTAATVGAEVGTVVPTVLGVFVSSTLNTLVGLLSMVALLGLLGVGLPRWSDPADGEERLFTKLRVVVLSLWPLYAVISLLDAGSLGVLLPSTEVITVLYLDVIMLAGFVTMTARGWRRSASDRGEQPEPAGGSSESSARPRADG